MVTDKQSGDYAMPPAVPVRLVWSGWVWHLLPRESWKTERDAAVAAVLDRN